MELFANDPQRRAQMEKAEARKVQAAVRESERQWRQEGTDPKAMQQAESAGQDVKAEGETLAKGRKRFAEVSRKVDGRH